MRKRVQSIYTSGRGPFIFEVFYSASLQKAIQVLFPLVPFYKIILGVYINWQRGLGVKHVCQGIACVRWFVAAEN